MKFFSDVPSQQDILSVGRQKAVDLIGNKGLILRKGIGTIRRIAEQLSPIGTKPKTELDFRPQRDNMWDFIPPILSRADHRISNVEVGKLCQELYFEPRKLQNTVDIKYGGEKRSYPGMVTQGNLKASFICPMPDIIGVYFRDWFELVVDVDGYYSPKNYYSGDGQVSLYNRTGAINIAFTVRGLFPITIGSYKLSMGGKDYIKYDVELNVDLIEEVPVSKM